MIEGVLLLESRRPRADVNQSLELLFGLDKDIRGADHDGGVSVA